MLYAGVPYVFTANHSSTAWIGTDVAQVKISLETNVLENSGNDPLSNIK